MSAPIIGSNIKLEIQSTVSAPVTITGITLASPGVVTAAAHGLINGDVAVLNITSGMAQLNGQACRVANITTNTFELEGISTLLYSPFIAGTVVKVTAFLTFDKSQSVSAPNPAPKKIDVTCLIDVVEQTVFGLPAPVDGTIGALFNPGGTTEALIAAATLANTPLAIRITYSDQRKTIMNAFVSGGFGFDLPVNDAAKSTVAFTPIKQMLSYAT